MKITKTILGLIITTSLLLPITGCSFKVNNLKIKNKSSSNINLNDLNSYEDVKLAYDQNIKKIINDEQIQKLDNVTFNDVLEYAKKASNIILNIEDNEDKILTIERLVSIDDLIHNTSENVMKQSIKYIIKEYKKNNLQDKGKIFQYQYIVHYLDEILDYYPDMNDVDNMIFDMYQVIEDTIRDIPYGLEANFNQINDNIHSIEDML